MTALEAHRALDVIARRTGYIRLEADVHDAIVSLRRYFDELARAERLLDNQPRAREMGEGE